MLATEGSTEPKAFSAVSGFSWQPAPVPPNVAVTSLVMTKSARSSLVLQAVAASAATASIKKRIGRYPPKVVTISFLQLLLLGGFRRRRSRGHRSGPVHDPRGDEDEQL